MKRLQVLLNDEWEYVFCKNELLINPIITKNKTKAIKGNENSLNYFQKYFGNHKFRISN